MKKPEQFNFFRTYLLRMTVQMKIVKKAKKPIKFLKKVKNSGFYISSFV